MNFMDGENNFEIILYLIIVVGGILANAYRSFVKKKGEERKSREHTAVDFPEIDDDISFEPEVEIRYEYEPVEASESIVEKEKITIEDGVSDLAQTEVENVTIESEQDLKSHNEELKDLINSEIKDRNWDSNEDEENTEAFDLKKAIIYSEIVNAKYI